ncbi:hypothetical protein HPP92_013621 [Vanilla planifolia]|uniref:Uncharacterized protein n=1 Tax=Vanilla planifolia TaxID=51239 RepID=A0A835R3W0_VANPL|nr:hypothetical protein HPP92_013621 [Vanilla planifolia]
MGESGGGPAMAPLNVDRGDQERWMHFDNSVNAISFGFVATAILISMFLIMAIFERFLRPQTSLFASFTEGRRRGGGGLVDIETQRQRGTGKIDYPSPMQATHVLVFVCGVNEAAVVQKESAKSYILARGECLLNEIRSALNEPTPMEKNAFRVTLVMERCQYMRRGCRCLCQGTMCRPSLAIQLLALALALRNACHGHHISRSRPLDALPAQAEGYKLESTVRCCSAAPAILYLYAVWWLYGRIALESAGLVTWLDFFELSSRLFWW